MKHYNYQDAINSYSARKAAEERQGDWPSYYFFRPLSFYISPLLANLGFLPGHITFFSFILLLLMPFTAALSWNFVLLAILLVLLELLDCIDGNLARMLQKSSTRGQFLDFIVDLLKRISAYSVLALMISDMSMIIALGAALLATLARVIRIYSEQLTTQPGLFDETGNTAWYASFLFGLEHALPLLLLGFGWLQQLPILLWGILLYSLGDFIISFIWAWHKTQ